MPPFGLVGPTFQHPLSTVNAELTVNWVPEVTSGGQAKSSLVLVKRPGLNGVTTAGTARWRGGIEQNGRAFTINGVKFTEITYVGGAFVATDRSTVDLADDGKPASTAANGDQGDQIAIAAGGLGYIFTLSTNTLAQITDPQFPANVVQVAYVDGYFIWIVENSTTFYLSSLYDGTAYAATDIGEKSKTHDYIMAVFVDQDEGKPWFIGKQKTEVWWNDGGAGFPFSPVDLIIPYGTGSRFSWTNLGSSIYGLGQNKDGGRVVLRYQGYNYERISHHAMEAAVQDYSETAIANAQGFAFEWRGHRFYALTFVEANTTWVYDESTDMWTQWDHWDAATATSEAFIGIGHMFAFGAHLMGSLEDGTIYEWSADYLDDDGSVIRRVRRAPYVHKSGYQVRHDQLTIGFQMGTGLSIGQGSDPTAIVRWSDNQAKSWSFEKEVKIGQQGRYKDRAVLRRLGVGGFNGRVYEVVVTDPVIDGIADEDLIVGRVA